MSETSPGRLQRLWNSSIGPKLVMGVTGLILVGFAFVHMAGNLQIYAGRDTFNHYAQTLKGTPLLLWGVRVGLLVSVVLHIAAAVRVTRMNWAARPQPYATPRKYRRTTFAALFMRGSGLVLLAFIVYHLLHFTVGVVQPETFDLHEVLRGDVWLPEANAEVLKQTPAHMQRHDAYGMFVRGFQQPAIAISYIVAMLLLGSHLRHGTVSMFATLGYHKGQQKRIAERVGLTLAAVITLANLSFPIAVLAGIVTL